MKCGIDPYADNESRYNQAQQRPDDAKHNAPDRDSPSLQLATTASDAATGSPAEDDATPTARRGGKTSPPSETRPSTSAATAPLSVRIRRGVVALLSTRDVMVRRRPPIAIRPRPTPWPRRADQLGSAHATGCAQCLSPPLPGSPLFACQASSRTRGPHVIVMGTRKASGPYWRNARRDD